MKKMKFAENINTTPVNLLGSIREIKFQSSNRWN